LLPMSDERVGLSSMQGTIPSIGLAHSPRLPRPPAQGGQVTREEAAKLPLWVRRIAAKAWCDAWNDRGRGMEDFRGPHYDLTYAHVVYKFALDLSDLPAQDELTPYLTAAVEILKFNGWRQPESQRVILCKEVIDKARALRAAAQGASHE